MLLDHGFSIPVRARRRPLRSLASLMISLCALLAVSPPADALEIDFNGGTLTIFDNAFGDLNPTIGILDFNTTLGSYQLQGTVDTVAGPNVVSLIGSPTASLRLTNFVAEALAPALPALIIKFSDTLPGSYSSITAADSIDAYAAHATGNPIPAAMDYVLDWQGYVDGWGIMPYIPGVPPYPNPFVPASSPPVPYTVVTQGPITFTAPFNNPLISAYLTIQLGMTGDQIILQNSAELGIVAIPEASTFVLAAIGTLGIGILGRRRFTRDH